MADALCGPSNSLQNFQKHTSVDRTLQQDRLRSRQSPLQGFRTPKPDAGILEAEFEAFKAGEPVLPLPYQQQLWQNQNSPPSQIHHPHSHAIDWASDFQNLHMHDARAGPLPSSQLRTEAPLQRGSSSQWQQEFLQQNQTSSSKYEGSSLGPNYAPFVSSVGNGDLFQSQYSISPLVQQPEAQVMDSFDEEAFERAFDAAKLELQGQESSFPQENTVIEPQPAETFQSQEDKIDYRIGSDRILDNNSQRKDEKSNERDADELARTAGQLLDNVKHDQSTKFRQSSFLSLMRQLRDKEVKVEGDNLVEMWKQNTQSPRFALGRRSHQMCNPSDDPDGSHRDRSIEALESETSRQLQDIILMT
ncbi:MAG: hypothetical protein Q9223_002550 [Gallowayella weberi]